MLIASQSTPLVPSLFEILERGGLMMWPIAACSVIALAFAVERWVRLRPGALGRAKFAQSVVEKVRSDGPEAALGACKSSNNALARILERGLEHADLPFLERDSILGDAAAHETKLLGANLRPLLIVWLIAPLLGLLGTVWGMIESFGAIADSGGIGRPELLASGIYQALTTTAAGLTVSIPAVVIYHLLRGRIEAFARRVESSAADLQSALEARRS
jgi:biopolymer transport protein ExbB